MNAPASPPASPPPPTSGARARLRRARGYLLERLRSNVVLRVTMAVALLCYGGIPLLVIWQDDGVSRLDFRTAGVLLVMSLASWSLLFWWYPVLARTADHLSETPDEGGLTQALELIAIACVVIVHALLASIMLYRAGGG